MDLDLARHIIKGYRHHWKESNDFRDTINHTMLLMPKMLSTKKMLKKDIQTHLEAYPIHIILYIYLSIKRLKLNMCSIIKKERHVKKEPTFFSNIPEDGCASFTISLCKLSWFTFYIVLINLFQQIMQESLYL